MKKSELLEARVGWRLISLGKTLATAESCSGGLVAHRITNVPGSSAYFLGGVVAYSNKVKAAVLGVSKSDLTKFGAVSEPVACQMAEGARKRFGSDFALATTGIAGPDGGTATKPVGLVYIAVAGPYGTVVKPNLFPGTRAQIKERTAERALELLLESVA